MSSVYLHCDQHENHNLRMLMDMVFGNRNFQNEISWCYTGASGSRKRFPRKHDSILFYGKRHVFNRDAVRVSYSEISRQRDKYGSLTSWGEKEPGWLNEKGKVVEDYWTDIQVVMNHGENVKKQDFKEPMEFYKELFDNNMVMTDRWIIMEIT